MQREGPQTLGSWELGSSPVSKDLLDPAQVPEHLVALTLLNH